MTETVDAIILNQKYLAEMAAPGGFTWGVSAKSNIPDHRGPIILYSSLSGCLKGRHPHSEYSVLIKGLISYLYICGIIHPENSGVAGTDHSVHSCLFHSREMIVAEIFVLLPGLCILAVIFQYLYRPFAQNLKNMTLANPSGCLYRSEFSGVNDEIR
jgi:hypothetical protein